MLLNLWAPLFRIFQPFAEWASTSSLNHVMTNEVWAWPAAETIHFIGLAFLVGAISILDLRLLGVAKRLPIEPLHRLVPWGVAGFLANAITGFLFYTGDPLQFNSNPMFQWKMVFVALAGLNIMYFYVGGVFTKVAKLGPGADAPLSARIVAGSSLFLWFGVMTFGRMLPFVGNAF